MPLGIADFTLPLEIHRLPKMGGGLQVAVVHKGQQPFLEADFGRE